MESVELRKHLPATSTIPPPMVRRFEELLTLFALRTLVIRVRLLYVLSL
ncbi:MAG TPA: hypothetical protein VEG61_03355 [Candidatus Dormibacteraeota bacterium]|nr:hypothetical protein [Candidatus Dormibacteraeota bacterium]